MGAGQNLPTPMCVPRITLVCQLAADGLPPSVEAVSVVWEKGAKLSYTDPCAVDSHGQARFSQIMRQVSCTAACMLQFWRWLEQQCAGPSP
jgi:hypothetical protein